MKNNENLKRVVAEKNRKRIIALVKQEIKNARANYPEMHSAHEGFSILNEEIDELWEHVKVKQGNRNIYEMEKEAIQVAAMAILFAAEICTYEKGNK